MQLEDRYYLYSATLSDINNNEEIDKDFQVVLYIKPEDESKKTPFLVHRNRLKRSLIYLGLASPSLYSINCPLHNLNPLVFIVSYKRTSIATPLSTYFLNIGNPLDPKRAKYPWLKDIAYETSTIKPKVNKFKTFTESLDPYYITNTYWNDLGRR